MLWYIDGRYKDFISTYKASTTLLNDLSPTCASRLAACLGIFIQYSHHGYHPRSVACSEDISVVLSHYAIPANQRMHNSLRDRISDDIRHNKLLDLNF